MREWCSLCLSLHLTGMHLPIYQVGTDDGDVHSIRATDVQDAAERGASEIDRHGDYHFLREGNGTVWVKGPHGQIQEVEVYARSQAVYTADDPGAGEVPDHIQAIFSEDA